MLFFVFNINNNNNSAVIDTFYPEESSRFWVGDQLVERERKNI